MCTLYEEEDSSLSSTTQQNAINKFYLLISCLFTVLVSLMHQKKVLNKLLSSAFKIQITASINKCSSDLDLN